MKSVTKITLRTFSFVFALLPCIGCLPQPQSSSQTNMINGVKIEPNDPAARSVVALLNDDGVHRTVFGSGVIIGKRKILTVAHNFFPFDNEVLFDTLVGPISGFRATKQNTKIHPQFLETMKKYQTPNGLNIPPAPAEPAGDLAVVTFQQDLPDRFLPLQLASTAEQEMPGSVWAAGYGWTKEPNPQGEGKPSMDLRVVEFQFSQRLRSVPTAMEFVVEPLSASQGVCSGDSGGPALRKLPNGDLRVMGVLSRSAAQQCAGFWAVFTSATKYRDWIEQQQ